MSISSVLVSASITQVTQDTIIEILVRRMHTRPIPTNLDKSSAHENGPAGDLRAHRPIGIST
jgi:hypothetical protein